MIIWRSRVQFLVMFNFCALNQTQSLCGVQTSFSPQTLHRVLAQTSTSLVCIESKLCYIGAPAKLTPPSLRGLTWTLHKLPWTLSDSVPVFIKLVQNTWGRVKTSFSSGNLANMVNETLYNSDTDSSVHLLLTNGHYVYYINIVIKVIMTR